LNVFGFAYAGEWDSQWYRSWVVPLDDVVLSVCCSLVCAAQALLLHNSVIKHAVYQNVGWVVEQEGDSFSVVFHEAEDAVAFTLQV
jgi:hypothetical protein